MDAMITMTLLWAIKVPAPLALVLWLAWQARALASRVATLESHVGLRERDASLTEPVTEPVTAEVPRAAPETGPAEGSPPVA